MTGPEGGEMFERSFRPFPPLGRDDPAAREPLGRLGRDLQIVLHNELETRRFLSHEVYGVPDELLDDVLRVRLSDLE